jgi:hypothetical protein
MYESFATWWVAENFERQSNLSRRRIENAHSGADVIAGFLMTAAAVGAYGGAFPSAQRSPTSPIPLGAAELGTTTVSMPGVPFICRTR